MKTGVIDVGGGLRGIYGAGVFDWCMNNGISFDFCAGVSAGGANISSYMANQPGRNFRFYTDYTFRKEYMSFYNFLKTGSYLNLGYIYGTLTNSDGEDPLDYQTIKNSGKEAIYVATDAETGRPTYFTLDDMKQDDYTPVMASCCLPIVDKACVFKGREYFDGGMSDPIPFKKVLAAGCDKFVLILTKPRDFYRETTKDERYAKILERSYPAAAKCLSIRGDLYNFELDQVKDLEKEGRALIVAPKDTAGMKTLTKSREAMERMYSYGLEDARAIKRFLSE